jgi:Na+/proline symporter
MIYIAKYKHPQSTDRELMRVSRKAIKGFGICMGILASILLQMEVGLQYVYLTMGIWIGSAVTPILLVIWKKMNKTGAIAGCLGGLVSDTFIWLVSSFIQYGELSIMSIGREISLLLGNISSTSIGSVLTIFFISIIGLQYCNFEIMKQKILFVDEKIRQT